MQFETYEPPLLQPVGTLHELTLTVKEPMLADGIFVKGIGAVGS